ncbi:dephospho-CoA kinase domain-containing protein [Echinops telfairi]|uniref:Dephospho-CoA kinase domain-containing protein n=1 Tax=Echinops telfairi TaxID=9371 RepID=A0ABM0ITU5_ECHTE|nr:dephospho-CoA kinase domain-containing protein [Echinops telfairi]
MEQLVGPNYEPFPFQAPPTRGPDVRFPERTLEAPPPGLRGGDWLSGSRGRLVRSPGRVRAKASERGSRRGRRGDGPPGCCLCPEVHHGALCPGRAGRWLLGQVCPFSKSPGCAFPSKHCVVDGALRAWPVAFPAAPRMVQPGYPAHRRIVEAFGTEVLLENGDINRVALGDLIFNQPDLRRLLNTITHPAIGKEMMKETFKYFLRGYRYVILDVPLLFETQKLLRFMKHTVVVYCDRDTQLKRLMQRNQLKLEEAEARIGAQLPLKEKVRLARHVLDNSGEWSVTKRQVILLHAHLESSLEYLPLRLGALTGLAGAAALLYLLARCLLPLP